MKTPHPPAEQKATKETSGGFHVWRDISTAPKDGSRFVATGHNYGLYSEGRHICVAQWFRGCWMEASDWNETSELKYLTHWMPLPSPPDDVAAPAEQQAASSAVLKAIREANMQLVRTGDDAFMLVPYKVATTEAAFGGVYAKLPRAGAIGYASVVDVASYATHMTIEPHLPGVRDIALWTTDQMRDFADRTHALRMEQAAPKAAPLQQEWRLVLPGGKHTDEWESARVGDYNRGWNDYRKAAIAALNSVVWPARASGNWVAASTWLRNNYQDYPNITSLCDAMLEAAPQQEAQEPDHSLRTDALCQLAYCNGMKAGWNYCVDGNEVDFARAMEGVSEAMKVLRELRENAPQPAPAPLSDAQIKELIEDGVFLGNCKEIVRAIEHAHVITQKGGSNGL